MTIKEKALEAKCAREAKEAESRKKMLRDLRGDTVGLLSAVEADKYRAALQRIRHLEDALGELRALIRHKLNGAVSIWEGVDEIIAANNLNDLPSLRKKQP